MRIDRMRVTCQACKTVSNVEIVVECPVSVAAASMEAARCPKCGSNKLGLGGNFGGAPPLTASEGERADWWKCNGEHGTSSISIFYAFTGDMLESENHDIPHDPDDFRRCKQLLDLMPEWRSRLNGLMGLGRYWLPFIEAWNAMEKLYIEELPTGRAPKLYALMQGLVKQSEALRK